MVYQILAMARYEMLMQWRRGSLRIITAGLIILPLLYMVAARDSFVGTLATHEVTATELYHLNTSMLVLCTIPLLATVLVAIPIIMTESIPFDHQYHVKDCLWALPLTRRTYLLGKVAGTWLGLGLALALACVVIGLAGLVLIGSFDLGLWLTLWVGGLLLFTLFAGGISVLLAAGLPNRRRAVFVGLMLVVVVVAAYAGSPVGMFYIYILSSQYMPGLIDKGFMDVPSILSLPDLIVGAGILLLSGVLAWGWLRRQENH